MSWNVVILVHFDDQILCDNDRQHSAATIPQFLSPIAAVGYENPIVQSYRLQHALAASNLQSSAIVLQQQAALLQQQSLAI